MRRLFRALVILLVVMAVAAGVAVNVVLGRLDEPYKGYGEAERLLDIPPRTTVTEIGRRLVKAGIVSDPCLFRIALWRSGTESLQAGEYLFAGEAPIAEVIDRLARGDVFTRRLTFPEGLTIADMAQTYEEQGFGTAEDFVRAAQNARLIADLDPEATDLEGYLFPETYQLARHDTAAVLVRAMVERFKVVFTDDLRGRAEAAGFTARQAVALAAIVEKEAGVSDERPLVAAVYRNRLRIGMPMQADPTVIYALQKAGTYDGNIRRTDLDFDSPYNTYRYGGLTPGPIAAPGEASLVAALSPADVPYLYFVSRNDGTHAFARTLAEHNSNVRRFQVEYFHRRRQAARSAITPPMTSEAAGRE